MIKQIIVIIGEQGVGKTTLVNQITNGKNCNVMIDATNWQSDFRKNPNCDWIVIDDGRPTEQLNELCSAQNISVRLPYDIKKSVYHCPNIIITSNNMSEWESIGDGYESGGLKPFPGKTIQFIYMTKRF